ncbi:MAG: prolyl oligopeptidase family serine peptidase, partial [Bacteroidota bacterium]|nr:prolyl oligopeptidase family serine peptidase [Bacteroidota bacterium]
NVTPWTRKQRYIANSPLFGVNEITTPLLMMHNPKDNAVPFNQAIELFMAMRRARKVVWLLQYANGGHTVRGADAIDYTIRMQQFFGYYLKNAPEPEWMRSSCQVNVKEMGFKN